MTSIRIVLGIQKGGAHAGTVLLEAGCKWQKKAIDGGQRGYGDSREAEEREPGGKLKPLPKRVGTSVGRPASISLFQNRKSMDNSFRKTDFVVKKMALNKK